MNMFGVVGQIVARDRKGNSALLTLRYGKPQKIGDASTQFVDFARVRIPSRVMERASDEDIEKGAVVSVQGYVQGVVHQDKALGSISLVNELVALHLVRTQLSLEPDEAMKAAETKGQGVYLRKLNEQAMSEEQIPVVGPVKTDQEKEDLDAVARN